MEITFKTHDKQRFTIIVDGSECIEDLIEKVGKTIGDENLYRLVYAGKFLEEKSFVKDCNLSPALPIIVMVTKPEQQAADKESIEEMEIKKKKKFIWNNPDNKNKRIKK